MTPVELRALRLLRVHLILVQCCMLYLICVTQSLHLGRQSEEVANRWLNKQFTVRAGQLNAIVNLRSKRVSKNPSPSSRPLHLP
jgi:hypothetical protein